MYSTAQTQVTTVLQDVYRFSRDKTGPLVSHECTGSTNTSLLSTLKPVFVLLY